MPLLSQKAKEDLEIVNMICSNLHLIIIQKNRNHHASLDSFVDDEDEKDYFSIPKNSIKSSYKTNIYLRSKNLISFISKKIKILFHM